MFTWWQLESIREICRVSYGYYDVVEKIFYWKKYRKSMCSLLNAH